MKRRSDEAIATERRQIERALQDGQPTESDKQWYQGYLRALDWVTGVDVPSIKEIEDRPIVLGDKAQGMIEGSDDLVQLRGEVAACRWITYPNRGEV